MIDTKSANRSSPSTDAPDEHGVYVRALCHHHAGALLAMASVVLGDVDSAGEIVADTIAAVCRDGQYLLPTDRETRRQLARSVYHRCLGQLAMIERFPRPPG